MMVLHATNVLTRSPSLPEGVSVTSLGIAEGD